MIVMKFGGTSVGSADRILDAANIVKSYLDKKPLVVVSAMGGVTNILIEIAEKASQGDKEVIDKSINMLLEKHEEVAKLIKNKEDREKALYLINNMVDSLKTLYKSIYILGELTKRSLDLIMSYGERLSALLFTFVLNELNIKAEQVVTDTLVITDDNFGNAVVDMVLTKKNVNAKVNELLNKNIMPVITGFIGGTKNGVVTTIGRSGSDYTASIIGAVMEVEEIWIWTDVDGVLTADPRLVKGAKTIPELSYKEATELSYFGAKVIHPKTMQPAVKDSIPIRIKNTFNPKHEGTVIKSKIVTDGKVIRGITAIKNLSLINVEGAGMMGVPGIAAKVFGVAAENRINVLMISQASSEHSICFIVNKDDSKKTVKSLKESFAEHIHLKNIETISIIDDVAIVAIVGENMRGRPGVAGILFSNLGKNKVNVIAIAQGSSELNISFVVKETELLKTVQTIHDDFGLGK